MSNLKSHNYDVIFEERKKENIINIPRANNASINLHFKVINNKTVIYLLFILFCLIFFFFFLGLLRFAFFKGYGCNFATKETDNEHGLLHEIDSALKFGKGFLFGKGAFPLLCLVNPSMHFTYTNRWMICGNIWK